MRICFFGNFTAGGTESATFLIANALAADSAYEVFVLNGACVQNTFYLDESVRYSVLQRGSVLRRNVAIYKYIRSNRIDMLVSVEAMTGIFTLLPTLVSRCRHIVWEHANYFQNQGSKHIQKIRQLELCLANAYVVLTQRDLRNFRNHFKVHTRLLNIYNVADSQADAPYDADSKVIVSAGHICWIKNFIVIPDVAKIVFARHPDWRWHIYGSASSSSGEIYNSVKSKIEKLRLQNHVILKGRSNDMPAAYREASIYVMTSLQEGLPMVLLEAKSHKLPLISFDIETGPDEIIRNGVNGFLIPAYDVEAMADKICKLIEDNAMRRQFSDASALDLEKFAPERIVSAWNELITTVSANR